MCEVEGLGIGTMEGLWSEPTLTALLLLLTYYISVTFIDLF